MVINERGLALIKEFEGYRSAPYQDPIGIWTIGYGSTYDKEGHRLTGAHPPVTRAEATVLLKIGVRSAERSVSRLITAPLNENQFSALVSFTYNVGGGNLQRSTMRMLLNRLEYDNAADEFSKWRRAGGRVLPGLVRRRAAEQAVFLSLPEDKNAADDPHERRRADGHVPYVLRTLRALVGRWRARKMLFRS